jgi:diguanylate cyclase (GGDEF)-like protein
VTGKSKENRLGRAERDLIALGIVVAAILLFVTIGGLAMPGIISTILVGGNKTDNLLVSALLLNIALVIFGWRRYRELTMEVAERRRAEDQARQLAELDPLTGCLNRRSMVQATEQMRCHHHSRSDAIAYGMIDVDLFKQINDIHGHMAGDVALVELCHRFRTVLPREARLARLGGDEFAFIVPYKSGEVDRIDDLVIRLFEVTSYPVQLPNVTIDVSISIGIASDEDVDDADGAIIDAGTLMHRADMAMYQAKKEGRSRYFWFDPAMESELRFRNQLETGIRRGITREEFVPFYEQQIDVESGDLVGFEMLARWRSPQLGLVSPDTFIPVAEEIGVISDLSEQLMAQAFVDAREWNERLTLSVNISPVQLRDPWFAQKLLKHLVSANFPPQRLEIEITESCLHESVEMVRSMITSLRNQGVKVSLDDFGTGYSSLEQLRSLPFDRLKIDRNFVSELGGPSGHSKIVDAIINLGRGLDMPITAEGVEDEHILHALKAMGGLKAQGYLYGKPESAEQVRQRLRLAGLLNSTNFAEAEPASQPASHADITPRKHHG